MGPAAPPRRARWGRRVRRICRCTVDETVIRVASGYSGGASSIRVVVVLVVVTVTMPALLLVLLHDFLRQR